MPGSTATSTASLLTARGLGRRYRRLRALADVDVDLARGEALALLGPNGAGKTTLLAILAGVGRHDTGTVGWNGVDARDVGWVPQRPAVYPRLTVAENLRLFAGLERVADPAGRAAELIAATDLGAYAGRRAEALSTGTLQRLNLAVALVHRPAAVLLDEPTATLSPDQRRRMWELLGGLRAREGTALVFSTQSVDEARRNADRVLVLAGGRGVFAGTVDELVAAHGSIADPPDDRADAAFVRLIEGVTDTAGPA